MTITASFNSWVICPKPNPAASLRLFCFPYAGGSAAIFRTWQDSLPKSIEVCAVELPGRASRLRETPFTRMVPLVEALALALLPRQDLPFAFFGHSMGALVSFEVASLLGRKYNLHPVHLFVSGRAAPQLPDPDPPIHALPEADFIQELRRLNGTPELVLENAELMQLLLPILRSDFAVLETYTYTERQRLTCPVTAFGGLDDREVSYEQLAAWREQTLASFLVQMFPGNHFFLHSGQALLLQAIATACTLMTT